MRVVNVRFEKCTHYIAHGYARRGSIKTGLANPFQKKGPGRLKSMKSRLDAMELYRYWLLGKPRAIAEICTLPDDAVLGCWCKPLPCHGDVIIEFWRKLTGK